MNAGLQVFSRRDLANVKTRALRRGLWYRALTTTERACIDRVMRLVDQVRSRLLANVIVSVLKKLEEAMENQVSRLMREVGRDLAKKISCVATEWGNKSAAQWAEDHGFIRYLAITRLNGTS